MRCPSKMLRSDCTSSCCFLGRALRSLKIDVLADLCTSAVEPLSFMSSDRATCQIWTRRDPRHSLSAQSTTALASLPAILNGDHILQLAIFVVREPSGRNKIIPFHHTTRGTDEILCPKRQKSPSRTTASSVQGTPMVAVLISTSARMESPWAMEPRERGERIEDLEFSTGHRRGQV